jgi:hypothetical protein
MDEKLRQIYQRLAMSNAHAPSNQGGNAHIIKELSQIINQHLDEERSGSPDNDV